METLIWDLRSWIPSIEGLHNLSGLRLSSAPMRGPLPLVVTSANLLSASRKACGKAETLGDDPEIEKKNHIEDAF